MSPPAHAAIFMPIRRPLARSRGEKNGLIAKISSDVRNSSIGVPAAIEHGIPDDCPTIASTHNGHAGKGRTSRGLSTALHGLAACGIGRAP